jgi:hypothetical protein
MTTPIAIAVVHRQCDDLVGAPLVAHPVAEGAAQVVRRAVPDAGTAADVVIWTPPERMVYLRPRTVGGHQATNRLVTFLDFAASGSNRHKAAAEAVWQTENQRASPRGSSRRVDMAFDIRKRFEGDDFDEDAVEEYVEELVRRFASSPEAKALDAAERYSDGLYWSNPFIQFGIDYCSATPADMTAADVDHVVFTILPRKVSADPEKAEEIVLELRAFWRFLQREFKLGNAEDCLAALGSDAIPRLEQTLGDPRNFGMAKSVFAMGKAKGYDIETEEGLQAWIKEVNAHPEQFPLPTPELPFDGGVTESLMFTEDDRVKKLREERKRKKKQARASRRRNR